MNLFDFLLWEATVLQREKDGGWSVHCGLCSESANLSEALSWDDALHMSREAGWRSRQINGSWDNICPACLETIKSARELVSKIDPPKFKE